MSGDPTFHQSQELIDAVWDALMLEHSGGPYRTVGELLIAGAETADVNHIIDVAITVYRSRIEGGGSGDVGTRTETP